MNRLLTPASIERIDAALDRFDVFAKPFTQTINDKITVVGLRIGQRPNHTVAFFGDRVIVRPNGTYTVRPAEEMTAPRFNYLHKVGTRVVAYPGSRDGEAIRTTTRTPAWTTSFGKPVVMVEDDSAWIALTHIDVIGGVL